MLQEHKIVQQLPEADAAGQEMPLDVGQLHHQGKTDRGRPEASIRLHQVFQLRFQKLLQTCVRKWVLVPGRRTEMHLHLYPVYWFWQMEVMARFGPRHRSIRNMEQALLQKQGLDFSAATFHPDVDIAALPHVRVRVKPCIGRTLQNGGAATLGGEKFSQAGGHTVHQAVMPANRFRLAGPLERKLHRRLGIFRQALDTRIGDSQHGLPHRHIVKGGPFFRSQRNSRRGLPFHSKAKPQQGKKLFFQRVQDDILFYLYIKKSGRKRTRLLQTLIPTSNDYGIIIIT